MSAPTVVTVAAASPAAVAGFLPGDELVTLNGVAPHDVIEYSFLVDEPMLRAVVRRGDHEDLLVLDVVKEAGEPLGLEVSSALFDRLRTCDNHCAFCFIHQLPKGMRKSLYQKDDDYRLSFLYGNFTTLTRFTEMDLERVLTERLSPLFVSIHATDPDLRSRMLRNPRGATSLRWLRALLDGGIEVHGQVVVCPGQNDGDAFGDTLAGVLDEYPELATVAAVPLGLSRFSHEPTLRNHTMPEAQAVCETVAEWQETFLEVLGHRMVYAADEYYLLAGLPFPDADTYAGFPQHENGIGMARAFEAAFRGDAAYAQGVRPGFFAWVDGAPPEGYRALRQSGDERALSAVSASWPVTILTGEYGAEVLRPLVDELGRDDVVVLPVANAFFGGNIGVAGLLTGSDVALALADRPTERRYLLPDACLSDGQFLDGLTLADLPCAVEVVPTDGLSLRRALDGLDFTDPPLAGVGAAATSDPSRVRSGAGSKETVAPVAVNLGSRLGLERTPAGSR